MKTPPIDEPPATAVPTAEDEMAEESPILDQESQTQFEQMLISCLQDIVSLPNSAVLLSGNSDGCVYIFEAAVNVLATSLITNIGQSPG